MSLWDSRVAVQTKVVVVAQKEEGGDLISTLKFSRGFGIKYELNVKKKTTTVTL